jgi:hypothetical protein
VSVVFVTGIAGTMPLDVLFRFARSAQRTARMNIEHRQVGASSLGGRFITNGQISDVTVNDLTIVVPEPGQIWILIAGVALLRVLAWRRAVAF